MGRLSENSSSYEEQVPPVTAEIVVPDGGAEGVIVAQGGAFGGWSLYAHEGRPAYCYNLFGLQQFKVYGESDPRRASTRCGWSSPTTAADSARAGRPAVLDGAKVGEGRVDATVPMVFSADETTRRRQRHRHPRERRPTASRTAASRAGSAGCRSTSATTRTTRPPHLRRGAVPDRDEPPVASVAAPGPCAPAPNL